MPDTAWTLRFSTRYRDQLGERAYRERRGEIERRLAELLKDPYRAAGSERLKFTFTGLRSARVAGGVRLIFKICEECRSLSDRSRNSLDCCLASDTPNATVNVLCLSSHYTGVPEEFEFDP